MEEAVNALEFTVPGAPVSWKRTGSGINPKTGKAIRFNPKKMERRKNDIWIACHKAMRAQGFEKCAGAVALFVLVKFSRPKSDPNRIWHTQVPDFDNCGKLVADALKGVAWDDDAQVVGGPPWKVVTDCEPGYEVFVLPLSDPKCSDASGAYAEFESLRVLSVRVLDRMEHLTMETP